ncbi:hypothetical protein HZ326_26685 [Fusarium oxysporum f. sp. albedinis]|nr:hypothetical protein HZ326_26685 [Fusarium oxysporum f. sp. albedinis]
MRWNRMYAQRRLRIRIETALLSDSLLSLCVCFLANKSVRHALIESRDDFQTVSLNPEGKGDFRIFQHRVQSMICGLYGAGVRTAASCMYCTTVGDE